MAEKVLQFMGCNIVIKKKCIRYMPTDLINVHEVLLNEKNKI